MIIECNHCHAKYQYDESKFEGRTSKKIRCAKCQQVFEIHSPAPAAPETASAPPAPAPSRPSPDSTITRRPPGSLGGTVERRLDPSVAITDKVDNPAITGSLRYSLAIIDGPDAGTVFRVERARTIIGRSGADIPLNDSEASRNHAVVDVRGSAVLLEDLGSTNGTMMNGERLDGSVELQNQSEFQIGSTTLMLIITEVD